MRGQLSPGSIYNNISLSAWAHQLLKQVQMGVHPETYSFLIFDFHSRVVMFLKSTEIENANHMTNWLPNPAPES